MGELRQAVTRGDMGGRERQSAERMEGARADGGGGGGGRFRRRENCAKAAGVLG